MTWLVELHSLKVTWLQVRDLTWLPNFVTWFATSVRCYVVNASLNASLGTTLTGIGRYFHGSLFPEPRTTEKYDYLVKLYANFYETEPLKITNRANIDIIIFEVVTLLCEVLTTFSSGPALITVDVNCSIWYFDSTWFAWCFQCHKIRSKNNDAFRCLGMS